MEENPTPQPRKINPMKPTYVYSQKGAQKKSAMSMMENDISAAIDADTEKEEIIKKMMEKYGCTRVTVKTHIVIVVNKKLMSD